MQKAKDRYHNRGGIEKAAKYYADNEEVLKDKANNKYRNSSQKEKEMKRKYGKIETKKWKKNKLKKCQINKILAFCIVLKWVKKH